MTNLMLKCQDTSQLISESFDRKLTLRERLGIRMHLTMCRFCRRYKKQLEFIRGLMAAYRRHLDQNPAEGQLSTEAKFRIKRTLAAKVQG